MSASPAGDDEAGFTLIEVLVAFAIVSLCLASLYSALAGHSRQVTVTDMHRQTLAYARTHLDSFGESLSVQDSPMTGRYPNGTLWRLSVRAISIGGATDAAARPFFVALEVFDRSGRSVIVLNSIKMLVVER